MSDDSILVAILEFRINDWFFPCPFVFIAASDSGKVFRLFVSGFACIIVF